MRSLAAAQTLAQRGTANLCRPASSAIGASRARLLVASTSPVLRTSVLPTGSFLATPAAASYSNPRCFSQTAIQQKKAGKKDKKGGASSPSASPSSKDDHADDDSGSHPTASASDAFNFADVESRWQRSDAHHEEKFKELKRALSSGSAGLLGDGEGGADVDTIGKAPVVVKGEAAGEADSEVPLSQLALVIPRAGGRVVELRMHNPASRKSIMSAIQTNPIFHGQQPQPDPNDELVLLIRLGAVDAKDAQGGKDAKDKKDGKGKGGASAAAVAAERLRRVHDLANTWREQIRRATERRKKTHHQWKKDKLVQPDDLHRLDRDLLKGQEKHMAKIDTVEKEVLKVAEQANRR